MPAEKGFFVDWSGKTRRVESPGDGYECEVDTARGRVEVLGGDGSVIHEADLWPSLEALEAAGVPIHLQ